MKIYVEEAVFSLFPFLSLFCLKADFDPSPSLGEQKETRAAQALSSSEKRVRLRKVKREGFPLPDPAFSWREGFKKFTAEKGAQSSLEILMREA